MLYKTLKIVIVCSLSFLFACQNKIDNYDLLEETVQIYPDYTDLIIPSNIAPLNFAIEENGPFWVEIKGDNGYTIRLKTKKFVDIPIKKWQKLLKENEGQNYSIDIFVKKDKKWQKYPTITNLISEEEIDAYMTYRLIEPGYELGAWMGIFERNLENFKERAILSSAVTSGSCMNCHLTNRNDPNQFVMHVRFQNSGTIIYQNGEYKRVNTVTKEFINPGIHPAWHPNGKFIAFSTNTAELFFHTDLKKRTESYDSKGNIAIYDIENNEILACPSLVTPDPIQETFPAWSPDGKYLYFCRTDPEPMKDTEHLLDYINRIRYDLLRISFDAETKTFGKIDTIINSSEVEKTVAIPRVSPDGRFIMIAMSDHGTFTVWQKDADLYVLDLETLELKNLEKANSDDSDSYHSWSSNSRWFVVASKRQDGLVTLPYLSHLDENGNESKAFVMPQKNPYFYKTHLQSYNVTELAKGANPTNIYEFEKAVKGPVTQTSVRWLKDKNQSK